MTEPHYEVDICWHSLSSCVISVTSVTRPADQTADRRHSSTTSEVLTESLYLLLGITHCHTAQIQWSALLSLVREHFWRENWHTFCKGDVTINTSHCSVICNLSHWARGNHRHHGNSAPSSTESYRSVPVVDEISPPPSPPSHHLQMT